MDLTDSTTVGVNQRLVFPQGSAIKIPILVAQGANDPRVKQAEAEQIVGAMRDKGIDHQDLLFPDEGHGFAKPENRLKFYGIAERFLIPYNEKLYACDLRTLDVDAMGRFFPHADIADIIRNMKAADNTSYNSTFTYPRGGAIQYVRALLSEVPGGAVAYGEALVGVDLARRVARTTKREIAYDKLVSSAPLDKLARMTGLAFDEAAFTYNRVLVFNLGFDKKGPRDIHWMYFPDKSLAFYRVGFYDNIFDAIRERDRLLHHPYDSYDCVTGFINQAVEDPDVLAIKICLYRTGPESPIPPALIVQPPHERAEVHDRRSEVARRDDVHHLLMDRRAVRDGPPAEIVLRCEQAERRRFGEHLDREVQTAALHTGLLQPAADAVEIDRQLTGLDGVALTRRRTVGRRLGSRHRCHQQYGHRRRQIYLSTTVPVGCRWPWWVAYPLIYWQWEIPH